MDRCPSCHAQCLPTARFCSACGSSLTEGSNSAGVRKTVTALFCDLVGSTSLGEARDPEALRDVMQRYFAAMREVIETHGGSVEKFIGDAVMAVFGVPRVHEDDALRAVHAAAAMRTRLAGLNRDLMEEYGVQLEVRVGLSTGEVVVGDGGLGTVATGDAINVAARLQQAAEPGQVLVGERTAALVRAAVTLRSVPPLSAKGKAEPVVAWRLVSVDPPPAAGSMSSRLVGRDRELSLMLQAYERSVADRSTQLFTLLGTAGVGKSRLMTEFRSRLPEPTIVLSGRCLSYGEGTALWPVMEMVRSLAYLAVGDGAPGAVAGLRQVFDGAPEETELVERLAPVAGLNGTTAGPEETQWALRRAVEWLGRDRPVVLLVDDLHWARPVLLDLIEHLVDWTEDTSLLLVVAARPEFLEECPQWGGGKLNAASALLEPLTPAEADRLLGELVASNPLPEQLRARVVANAGGVPLFVEQLLALLREEASGAGSPERGTAVDLPPTIAALLAARLDRLTTAERTIIDAASVIGQVFTLDDLDGLVALADTELRASVLALVRKALLRRTATEPTGGAGFAFAHALLHDAAYGAVAKLRRADLHERFARRLESRDLAIDATQLVAHHLERAVALRQEVRPLDAAGRALAAQAVDRLQEAAGQLAQGDQAGAVALLERAAALLPDHEPGRLELELAASVGAFHEADFARARELLQGVVDDANRMGDERLAVLGTLQMRQVLDHLGHEPTDAELSLADVVLDRSSAAGDALGVVLALRAKMEHSNTLARWQEVHDLGERLDRECQRLAPWLRHLMGSTLGWTGPLLWGPTPAREALAALEGEAAATLGLRRRIAWWHTRAVMLAMDDQPEAALTSLAEGQRLLQELRTDALPARVTGAYALSLCGRPAQAETLLRPVVESLHTHGETAWLSTFGPMLGELRYADGDLAEARRWGEIARDSTERRDVISQAVWRALLGKVEAREGRPDLGRTLLDDAVGWVLRSDHLNAQGEVFVSRAEVRELVGDQVGARSDLLGALESFRRKGNRAAMRPVEHRLAALSRR